MRVCEKEQFLRKKSGSIRSFTFDRHVLDRGKRIKSVEYRRAEIPQHRGNLILVIKTWSFRRYSTKVSGIKVAFMLRNFDAKRGASLCWRMECLLVPQIELLELTLF